MLSDANRPEEIGVKCDVRCDVTRQGGSGTEVSTGYMSFVSVVDGGTPRVRGLIEFVEAPTLHISRSGLAQYSTTSSRTTKDPKGSIG